jgi:hypothetical protein
MIALHYLLIIVRGTVARFSGMSNNPSIRSKSFGDASGKSPSTLLVHIPCGETKEYVGCFCGDSRRHLRKYIA